MKATFSARVLVQTTRFKPGSPGVLTRRPTFAGYDCSKLIARAFPDASSILAVPHDMTVGREPSQLYFTCQLPVPRFFAGTRLAWRQRRGLDALVKSLTAQGEKVLKVCDVRLDLGAPQPAAATAPAAAAPHKARATL